MSATPVPSQPNRTPWVIVGVLGCLVLCLLLVMASGGLYLLFGVGQKQPVTANLGTPTFLAPPSIATTETPAGPERIAFVSYRDGNAEIYVMNADPSAGSGQSGSGQTRLTDSPGDDWQPAWSPDGTRIAFASSRDGNYAIYVMNADGSGVVRLTDGGSPSWGPPANSEANAVTTNKGKKDV